METEMKISILMQGGCTRKEAETHLKKGTQIYRADEAQDCIGELLTGNHGPDVQLIKFDGKDYLIAYN